MHLVVCIIVERKPCRCGRFPPVVRTAVPVDGRFEHIVLSCNVTSDHAIIWIEKEAKRALELMREEDDVMEIPQKQRMERQETLAREHNQEYKAALYRAASLSVPDSSSHCETFDEHEDETEYSDGSYQEKSPAESSTGNKETWDELGAHLFDKDQSRHLIPREFYSK